MAEETQRAKLVIGVELDRASAGRATQELRNLIAHDEGTPTFGGPAQAPADLDREKFSNAEGAVAKTILNLGETTQQALTEMGRLMEAGAQRMLASKLRMEQLMQQELGSGYFTNPMAQSSFLRRVDTEAGRREAYDVFQADPRTITRSASLQSTGKLIERTRADDIVNRDPNVTGYAAVAKANASYAKDLTLAADDLVRGRITDPDLANKLHAQLSATERGSEALLAAQRREEQETEAVAAATRKRGEAEARAARAAERSAEADERRADVNAGRRAAYGGLGADEGAVTRVVTEEATRGRIERARAAVDVGADPNITGYAANKAANTRYARTLNDLADDLVRGRISDPGRAEQFYNQLSSTEGGTAALLAAIEREERETLKAAEAADKRAAAEASAAKAAERSAAADERRANADAGKRAAYGRLGADEGVTVFQSAQQRTEDLIQRTQARDQVGANPNITGWAAVDRANTKYARDVDHLADQLVNGQVDPRESRRRTNELVGEDPAALERALQRRTEAEDKAARAAEAAADRDRSRTDRAERAGVKTAAYDAAAGSGPFAGHDGRLEVERLNEQARAEATIATATARTRVENLEATVHAASETLRMEEAIRGRYQQLANTIARAPERVADAQRIREQIAQVHPEILHQAEQDAQRERLKQYLKSDARPMEKFQAAITQAPPGEAPMRKGFSTGGFLEGLVGEEGRLDRVLGQAAKFSIVYGGLYRMQALVSQGFAAAAGSAMDYQEALTSLALATGQTTEANAALAEQASKAGTELGLGAAVGVQLQARVRGLYGLNDTSQYSPQQAQAIGLLSENVAGRISQYSGTPVQQVAGDVAGLVRSFGLSPYEQPRIEDMLAMTSQQSGQNPADILSATTQIAAIAKQAGFDAAETMAIVAQIASQTGQTAQGVAGNISQIFSRASDPATMATLEGVGVNTTGTNLKEQIGQLAALNLDDQTLNQTVQQFGHGRAGQALAILLGQYDRVQGLGDSARDAPEGFGEQKYELTMEDLRKQLVLFATTLEHAALVMANSGMFQTIDLLVKGFVAMAKIVDAVVGAYATIPGPIRQAVTGFIELALVLKAANLLLALRGANVRGAVSALVPTNVKQAGAILRGEEVAAAGATAATGAAAVGAAGAAGAAGAGVVGVEAVAAQRAVTAAAATSAAAAAEAVAAAEVANVTFGAAAGAAAAPKVQGALGRLAPERFPVTAAVAAEAEAAAAAGGVAAGGALGTGVATGARVTGGILSGGLALLTGPVGIILGAVLGVVYQIKNVKEGADATRKASVEAGRAAAGADSVATLNEAAAKYTEAQKAAAAQQEISFSNILHQGTAVFLNRREGSLPERTEHTSLVQAEELKRQAEELKDANDRATELNPANAFQSFASTSGVSDELKKLAERGLNAQQQLDALNHAFDTMIRASEGATDAVAIIKQGAGRQFELGVGAAVGGALNTVLDGFKDVDKKLADASGIVETSRGTQLIDENNRQAGIAAQYGQPYSNEYDPFGKLHGVPRVGFEKPGVGAGVLAPLPAKPGDSADARHAADQERAATNLHPEIAKAAQAQRDKDRLAIEQHDRDILQEAARSGSGKKATDDTAAAVETYLAGQGKSAEGGDVDLSQADIDEITKIAEDTARRDIKGFDKLSAATQKAYIDALKEGVAKKAGVALPGTFEDVKSYLATALPAGDAAAAYQGALARDSITGPAVAVDNIMKERDEAMRRANQIPDAQKRKDALRLADTQTYVKLQSAQDTRLKAWQADAEAAVGLQNSRLAPDQTSERQQNELDNLNLQLATPTRTGEQQRALIDKRDKMVKERNTLPLGQAAKEAMDASIAALSKEIDAVTLNPEQQRDVETKRNELQNQIDAANRQARNILAVAQLSFNSKGTFVGANPRAVLDKQIEQAKAEVERTKGFLDTNPVKAQALANLAQLYQQSDQLALQEAHSKNVASFKPGDPLADVKVSMADAKAALDQAQAHHGDVVGAQAAYDQALYQYNMAQLAFAQSLASTDTTDPVMAAQKALDDLVARRDKEPDSDAKRALDPQIGQARARRDLAQFQEQGQAIQDAFDLHQMTLQQALAAKRAEADMVDAKIAAMKAAGDTEGLYALERYAVDLRKNIKSAQDDLQGQFNIGDIKLPTVYEIRRSLGVEGVNGRGGADGPVTNHVQINGADFALVVDYLNSIMGGSPSRATTPRRVASI